MNRLLLAAATALVMAAAPAPPVMAADGPGPVAVTPTPGADPTAASGPSATPDVGNGEIVIDPTFITEEPDPTAPPAGSVEGATGRPRVTPPPTHASTATTPSGTSLQVLSVLAIAALLPALLVGCKPGRRRR